MEWLAGLPQKLVDMFLTLQITDILDILIIAYMVYRLLGLVRRNNATRVLKGVLLILLVLWISSYGLRGLNYLLSHILEWGIVALIILFQPEIRRLLEQMGSSQ